MAIRSLKTNSFSRSLLVGNAYYVPPVFESIATVSVGSGGTGTITFSSIPDTWSRLQIRAIARSTSTDSELKITFNSDTGSNYSRHNFGSYTNNGAAAAMDANYTNSTGNIRAGMVSTSSSTSQFFAGNIIDIFDYKNTNMYKNIYTYTILYCITG